jgi:hypothetical protein
MVVLLSRSKGTAKELQRCSGRLRRAVCGACLRPVLRCCTPVGPLLG